MRHPRSALRIFLRSRIREQERRLRRGLALRVERPWVDEDPIDLGDDCDLPDWIASPRRKFHHGLRKTIVKLRIARSHLAEFDALRSA